MKIKIFAIISLLFCSLTSEAQNRYVLDLKAQKWEFKPTVFYIDKIIDNRQDKKNAGEALSDGKIVPIFFPQSMEEDLRKFLDNSLENAHIVSGKVKSAIRASTPQVLGVLVHMEPYHESTRDSVKVSQ